MMRGASTRSSSGSDATLRITGSDGGRPAMAAPRADDAAADGGMPGGVVAARAETKEVTETEGELGDGAAADEGGEGGAALAAPADAAAAAMCQPASTTFAKCRR